MGGSPAQAPAMSGALVSWEGLFSEPELDTITRYGDSLALEKAELSAGGASYDNIRKTLVAWVERNPKTEFFHRRLEEAEDRGHP